LADRASIRNGGAIVFAGSVNEQGSDTSRSTYYGLDGYDSFEATAAEDSEVASTDLTTATVDIAVARASIVRELGDLFVLTGPKGRRVDVPRLASSMAGEWDKYFMQSVANTIDNASTAVGTSGVDMSTDDQYDAIYTLELSSVPGPFFELLHNRQLADWQASLRGEGGAIQFLAATADMLAIKGPGFQGSYLGIDIYRSERVNGSGGNRYGALWGQGAVAYKTGTVEPPVGAIVTRPDAEILVEFERQGTRGISKVIGHGYMGMSITEQSRIVGIVTDQ
jgi:hypothetical protein